MVTAIKTLNKKLILPLLLLIIFIGGYLRFVNISPYKFYPDSYQNLIVAKNLTIYGSVAGALGEDGSPYPPYFMWSRPVYPLFINLTNLFIRDLTLSAQFVSYTFGVLSIVLIFNLLRIIYKNNYAGLFGAFFASISFNYTVWSGFVMSDTTGIFFFLLFLNFLFFVLDKKSDYGNILEILTGAVFSITVFSRYEYAILLIPIFFFLFIKRVAKQKMINIFVGFFVTSSILFVLLFPVADSIRLIINQNKEFLWLTVFVLAALPTFLKYGYKLVLKYENLISKIIIYSSVFTLLLISSNRNPDFQLPVVVGFSNFLASEVTTSLLGFIGIGLMLKTKVHKEFALFLVMSLIIMEIVYFKINPLQQRYHTHVLIFFIIGATFVLLDVFNKYLNTKLKKSISISCLFFIFAIQINMTQKGIRNWHDGDWFKKSYEEISAITLKDSLKGDEILISAMPEAYHYFTGNSVRGLSDEKPYVYLEDLKSDQEIIIVNDMAMRDVYPGFSEYLNSFLTKYKVYEYKTGSSYRFKYYSEKEIYPVGIFKLEVSDFLKTQ